MLIECRKGKMENILLVEQLLDLVKSTVSKNYQREIYYQLLNGILELGNEIQNYQDKLTQRNTQVADLKHRLEEAKRELARYKTNENETYRENRRQGREDI